VARESRTLERRQHELFIKSLLAKAHAEAGQWLNTAKRPDLRSLAKFRTAKAAFRFVETLYAAGAGTVVVVPVYAGRRGKLFSDWLLIKLPGTPSKRKALRKLCQDLCDQRDGALLPDKDIGESHLFMRLA
jgi:hypothetical protein